MLQRGCSILSKRSIVMFGGSKYCSINKLILLGWFSHFLYNWTDQALLYSSIAAYRILWSSRNLNPCCLCKDFRLTSHLIHLYVKFHETETYDWLWTCRHWNHSLRAYYYVGYNAFQTLQKHTKPDDFKWQDFGTFEYSDVTVTMTMPPYSADYTVWFFRNILL